MIELDKKDIENLAEKIFSVVPMTSQDMRLLSILTCVMSSCSLAILSGMPFEEYKKLINELIDQHEDRWPIG